MPKIEKLSLLLFLIISVVPLIFDRITFIEGSILSGNVFYLISFGISTFLVLLSLILFTNPGGGIDVKGDFAIWLCIAFIAISLLSAFIGIQQGAKHDYLVADLGKFIFFPLTLILARLVVKTKQDVLTILAWFYVAYFLATIKNVLLQIFYLDITLIQRPMSVYLMPAIALLVFATRKDMSDWFLARISGFGILLLVIPIYVLSDSLALFLISVILALLYFFYRKINEISFFGFTFYTVTTLFFLVITLITFDALIDSNAISSLTSANLAGGSYTFNKLFSFSLAEGFLDSVVALSGNRVLFILSALDQFEYGMLPVLFGNGLGGDIDIPLHELSINFQEYFDDQQHFIEIGYVEVFFRAGLLGLIVFFGLFFIQLKRGLVQLKTHDSGLIVASLAIVSYLLASFIFYADFPKVGIQSPWLLGLLFSVLTVRKSHY